MLASPDGRDRNARPLGENDDERVIAIDRACAQWPCTAPFLREALCRPDSATG